MVLEGVLDHFGDDAAEEWTGQFEARIGVDLDEPDFQIGVDHEVHPEDLEVILELVGVEAS